MMDLSEITNNDDFINSNSASRKRKKTTDGFTTRKRAAIACGFCRIRKTKCDNARPRCSICRHHDAKCVYNDDDEVVKPEEERHDDLVRRLEDIKQCLEQLQGRAEGRVGNHAAVPVPIESAFTTPGAGPDDAIADGRAENDISDVDPYASPYRAARCEAICRWPALKDWLQDDETHIESFLHQSDILVEHGQDNRSTIRSPAEVLERTPSIDERDIQPLCRSFLGHVHFRNPILDPEVLMQYAKSVSEHGYSWDAQSCLILVICAISCVLAGEKPPSDHVLTDPDEAPKLANHILKDPLGNADAYAQAAKRRIGLLELSILDVQCFFFLSIYEKLRMRPLESWFQLRQACMRLKAHLMRQNNIGGPQRDEHQEAHQVEQRVFWSCVRAEIELLPDMCLPSSGLDTFRYPDFPAAPTISQRDLSELPEGAGNGHLVPETLQAQSWLFFLAEISLRRTINANLRLLYRKSESYWIANPALLLKHHAECEEQIRLWYSHLPARLQFDGSATQHRSLSFYLESRFQDWREYILRPMLYCALHSDQLRPVNTSKLPSTPSTPIRLSASTVSEITKLAQEHIALCAELIPLASEHGRYGGTWLLCRRTFTCAMAILASVIADNLQPPDNWTQLIQEALEYLRQWTPEAKSVEAMCGLLERLFGRVRQAFGW